MDAVTPEEGDLFDEVSAVLSDSLSRPVRGAGDIVGEYELVRQLGEGGFGTVWEALHTIIEKRAAIKILSGALGDKRAIASRFVEEARAVNRIRHDHVVDIFDLGELPDGSVYLVMELLEGEELATHIAHHGAMDPTEICEVLGPIASALQEAHDKEIIHRDLKPENIFLSYDEHGVLVPKLLDFGVAKLVGEAARGVSHRTRTGTPIGTPHYMSPEQCLALEVDRRSDIYSFGVLLFECLTGKIPFDGGAYLIIANLHTGAPRPKVSDAAPSLGENFDDVVQQLMAVDRSERPDTILEAYDAFVQAYEFWADESEQDTARRPAKTLKSVPSADALMSVQPTRMWIRNTGLAPASERGQQPADGGDQGELYRKYALAFVVASVVGAVAAAVVALLM